jgi:hypothetical protein
MNLRSSNLKEHGSSLDDVHHIYCGGNSGTQINTVLDREGK